MRLSAARLRLLKIIMVTTVVLLINCYASGKRKDDMVVMKNGDRFTGEIKGLQHGELTFKSDYMKDSVQLDWERVESLESKDNFIVALTDGQRITGIIARRSSESNDQFTIVTAESIVEVSSPTVINIDPRENSFWNQLTGSIDYGFDFTSGSNLANSSLSSQVAFSTAKNSVNVAASSQFDAQTNAENANRFTFDSQYERTITKNWVAAGLFSLLKSDQQDLRLRSTYGAGFGRRLLQTDKTNLLVIGGGAYSHESYVPEPGTHPILNNAEALIGAQFSTFRFKTLSINERAFLFPSLTNIGRFRMSLQSNLRIELVRNFYWNFQLYENYDTHPPVSAPKNDLGLTTSVGWTF